MGEALSFPEELEGHAHEKLSPTNGGAVPPEPVLLSQLIQLLSQRPRHSLLLSDLGALLPAALRQKAKDQGGLRNWVSRYPKIFVVSGQPGKESVTLSISAAAGAQSPDVTAALLAADSNGGTATADRPAHVLLKPHDRMHLPPPLLWCRLLAQQW